MDASEKEEIRGYVLDAVGEAIAPLAHRVDRVETEVGEMRERQNTLAGEQIKQAQFMTQIAGSAAHAADVGLQAMRRAGEAEDSAVKIVQSAMTIHNASIAETVEATVTKAVKPLGEEVANLKTNDAAQNDTLDDIRTKLTTLVAALGHPKLRKALIIAAIIGAAIGGGVAGYSGVTGGDAAKHLIP